MTTLGLKTCSTCREHKPLDEFNRLTKSPDGRQWNCRACNAKWHADNKAHHNAMIRERNYRKREDIRRRLFAYKLERGCADCGERDPTVLEFDHLRDKEAMVSAMAVNIQVWERISDELSKCDVVCSNCHCRRTAMRANDIRWRLYLEHQDIIQELNSWAARGSNSERTA
jgi:hypothetical protein